ncbi:hypothetical protein HO173_007817 [Letharia columbiana]|uniref:Uncharacterized protein n=1 Tax=Letharia columbiana TaxID=112416 RepID=A0A8H6FSP2_9LECA|nr:uncharacterized protein HO173_007817 [Letharia columbiana]KAF6233987.1 hypothetical protein HO173_007817 [Letharia columbiana]
MNSDSNPPTSTPRYLPPHRRSPTHHGKPYPTYDDLHNKQTPPHSHEPATKWHSTHSILSLPTYQTYESTKTKDGMEDRLDGKSMGDTGQIYSEAPRPGCQQVLEDIMHALDFLQFYGRTMARRLGKEKNSENLAGTQARCGYISRISGGQCRHGTVKTSMRPGNTTTPSKSSPVEAYTDYGCLETQGKRWACISGLPAMGAMAIERGGSVTSVPLTHHSALWLAGLGGGISYYIMPPSHIHSSVALLS